MARIMRLTSNRVEYLDRVGIAFNTNYNPRPQPSDSCLSVFKEFYHLVLEL